MNSCKDCPAFLAPHEVPNKFGRSFGSAMCARYGTVLSRPGVPDSQNTKVQEAIGSKCNKWGDADLPPEPGRKHYVMLPDPTTVGRTADPTKQSACTSCAMCVNFVPESKVVEELGWTGGLCAARGMLLMSTKYNQIARNCTLREFGTVRTTIGGMQFLPEYEESFNSGAISPTAAYFKAKAAGFVEPSEYPTDKEVSIEDETAGIRAWRKYDDPEGSGNSVYFPVYDPNFFDDDERALIPKTGSDEHPELYIDHFGGMYGLGVAWMELDETPVFWGVAGVGKTELLRHASWIMQLPFRRISVVGSTEIDDVAGKMMFDPAKGTWFKYGRVPEAWGKPGVICLDEPNVAEDPAVWHFFRPLTDNSKQLVLDMNEGEIIDRNQDCYLGMAMNPAWDVKNVGALEIADADANRLFHTFIEMPPPELEREIIKARVHLDGWEIPDDKLDMVMAIAADIRGMIDEDALQISWAIRPQIKVARALRWFKPPTAYKRAVGDYLAPDAMRILLDQVHNHWSED